MKNVKIIADTFLAGELLQASEKIHELDDQMAAVLVTNMKAEYYMPPAKEPENLLYPLDEALELIETAESIKEIDEIIAGDDRTETLSLAMKTKKKLKGFKGGVTDENG